MNRSARLKDRVPATVVLGGEAESFLKTVVAFPPVPAGKEPELLLRAIDRLCTELERGSDSSGIADSERLLSGQSTRWGFLSSADEALADSMRQGLAKLAAAAADSATGPIHEGVIGVALSGVEMVMRGELMKGEAGDLAPLIPSFVYLVTLPALDQDHALNLSRRASEMIQGLVER